MLEGGSGNERIGQRDRDDPPQLSRAVGDLACDVDLTMRREQCLHGELVTVATGEELGSRDHGIGADQRRGDPSGPADVIDEDVGVDKHLSHGAPAGCEVRGVSIRSSTER